jgi:uncharacterized protein (TIRG00374 family)
MRLHLPSVLRRKRLWGSVLAVAFLVWCLYDLDLREVGLIVRRLRYAWLVWAMAVVIAVLWVRSARWRVLVHPMKAISAARMFSIYAVGQLANLIFPALTGQAVRVLLLHRAEGVSKTGVASTVVLEALLDGLSLVLFMVGASAVLVLPEWLQRGERWGALIILAMLAILIFFVHYRNAVGQWVQRLERHLPQPIYERLDRLWINFSEGLTALRSLRHLTLAFFCSVASWLGNLAIISLLLYAFGFVLPTGAALVLMIVNTIMLVFPVTPGNLGTYQVACVLGLSIFGVSKTDAVSYGLVLQATTFLPIAAMGAYQYFRSTWTPQPEEDPVSSPTDIPS